MMMRTLMNLNLNTQRYYCNLQDNVPGPGYYHNESTASSIKTQTKPKKYQFFGKSSQRFKHNQTQMIGPGEYET